MRLSCLQYTAEPDLEVSEKRLYPLLDQAVDAESDVALLRNARYFYLLIKPLSS